MNKYNVRPSVRVTCIRDRVNAFGIWSHDSSSGLESCLPYYSSLAFSAESLGQTEHSLAVGVGIVAVAVEDGDVAHLGKPRE